MESALNQNRRWIIAFAVMAVLYGLVCLGIGGILFAARQQIPAFQEYFSTPTSIPTATPHAPQPAKGDKIIKDDFSYKSNQWARPRENSSITNIYLKDGKLILLSQQINKYVMAQCTSCSGLKSPYFIQADFSTKQETDELYGIVFSGNDASYSDFYAFEIDAEDKRFYLYKYQNQSWMLRVSNDSDLIETYPRVNTLAVSMDGDLIGMYINGKQVDTYTDTGRSMSSGIFALYGDDSGFTVFVDNFYAYGK